MKGFLPRLNLLNRQSQNPSNPYDNVADSPVAIGHSVSDTRRRTTEEEEREPGERKRGTKEEGEETAATSTSSSTRERWGAIDGPPADDCCPICFNSFVVPCRAACGHWFCGGCILQYWNHTAALRPCNCPMCSRQIARLIPEASLHNLQEAEVTEVLKKVKTYNRLFVGGIYGFMLKVLELPLFIKRIFRAMMDPDRPGAYLYALRLFALILAVLYTISPFDFLPTGRHLTVIDLFDYLAMVVSFILYLIGLYLRRRRFQHVRELANVQP